MPDTHDYPLAQALGTGNLIHHARPAALPGRIETRCGQEGERTGRDGSFWCPDCLAMERAEADTHDERGGDESVVDCPRCRYGTDLHRKTCDRRGENKPAGLMRVPLDERTEAIRAHYDEFGFSGPTDLDRERDQAIGHLLSRETDLAKQLAAATARAEKAQALNRDLARSTMRHMEKLSAAREEAELRAGKAEARLAELRPIRAEWSTENTYDHPDDAIVDRALAVERVAGYPQVYSNVLTRQVYAGPWLRAGGVVTDPGMTLSAMETGADGAQAFPEGSNSSAMAAGLSGRCCATKLDGGIRHYCDDDSGGPHTHECGDCTHRWDDDTTEADHA